MKSKFPIILFLVSILILGGSYVLREDDPWATSQLIEPSVLMKSLKDKAIPKPLIFNIGYVNDIPGAINIGPIKEPENRKKFDDHLKGLKRNTSIVIYCGCCPFQNYPNVGPAFSLLTDFGFKNHKLLNLPVSLKADWIDKGFPLKK